MTAWRGRRSDRRDVYGRRDVPLVTPAEAAALDAAARERHDVPGRVLMESAGRAAALILHQTWPRGRVAVAAGSGNNGGDAVVLARLLLSWGRDVVIVGCGTRPPDQVLYHGHEIAVEPAHAASSTFVNADILVDGILGTGTEGAPREPAASAIEALNAADRPILALDLPSGVNAETGDVEGEAVRAAVTVCFGWPKIGLLFQPARSRCGRLVAVEIGFPPFHAEGEDSAQVITPAWASDRLPKRPASAHKGTSGRLLVLAGSEGMAGAAVLACRSAQRAGAGLIRIASPGSNRVVLQTAVPEATYVDRSAIDPEDAQTMHALLAGPGIGTDDGARRALDVVLENTAQRPVVFDADALNLFARDPAWLSRIAAGRDVVITPHPGELARLLELTVREIVDEPITVARAAADRFGCTVLLKGQPSIIASPGLPLLVNTTGSSDVAAAGMGDQLAGAIGAMLAAGSSAREAAAIGLFFSGRAADLADRGRSLGPGDVSDHLSMAFARPGADRPPRGLPFITFDQPPRW